MADYSFVTVFRLEASREAVWDLIVNCADWPRWWPGVKHAELLEPGSEDGLGRVWRYTFRSRLPYDLTFDSRATLVERPHLLEGQAVGELAGTGRWELTEEGSVTTVRYDWNVRTTKNWMELLAPVARPLFSWNHDVLMDQAGHGLAQQLNTQLVGPIEHRAG